MDESSLVPHSISARSRGHAGESPVVARRTLLRPTGCGQADGAVVWERAHLDARRSARRDLLPFVWVMPAGVLLVAVPSVLSVLNPWWGLVALAFVSVPLICLLRFAGDHGWRFVRTWVAAAGRSHVLTDGTDMCIVAGKRVRHILWRDVAGVAADVPDRYLEIT